MSKKLIALCACPMGLAHTFMAAQALEEAAVEAGYEVKIETQGALGVENKITPDDITHADVVLLVTDIEIDDAQRFIGVRTIKTSIKTFLLQPQQIIEAVKCIMKKPVVYLDIP